MVVKLLGMVDIAAAFILLFHAALPLKLILFISVYLIVKGVFFIFTGDYLSYADTTIGVYAVLMLIGISFTPLTALAAVYLVQKGLLSLV